MCGDVRPGCGPALRRRQSTPPRHARGGDGGAPGDARVALQAAELRFTDEPGLHRFETQVLARHPFAVPCAWPVAGERRCRRHAARTRVPGGAAYPRVRLPLTDGACWEGADVRDVLREGADVRDASRGGLRLALPPEVMFPLGRPARIELLLGPEQDARLELLGVARNLTCDDATGQMVYGVEFLAPALDAEMALECFAAALGGR